MSYLRRSSDPRLSRSRFVSPPDSLDSAADRLLAETCARIHLGVLDGGQEGGEPENDVRPDEGYGGRGGDEEADGENRSATGTSSSDGIHHIYNVDRFRLSAGRHHDELSHASVEIEDRLNFWLDKQKARMARDSETFDKCRSLESQYILCDCLTHIATGFARSVNPHVDMGDLLDALDNLTGKCETELEDYKKSKHIENLIYRNNRTATHDRRKKWFENEDEPKSYRRPAPESDGVSDTSGGMSGASTIVRPRMKNPSQFTVRDRDSDSR